MPLKLFLLYLSVGSTEPHKSCETRRLNYQLFSPVIKDTNLQAHICAIVCASAGMLYTFHPQASTEHPVTQFFFQQMSMKQPIFLQGWEIHFSVFHKDLDNFRIKDFDMLRFSSQKIVNLSGTQHSSFYPESGLLPLDPDTPPFLIKKQKQQKIKINKFLKPTKSPQTYHKVFDIFNNPKNCE